MGSLKRGENLEPGKNFLGPGVGKNASKGIGGKRIKAFLTYPILGGIMDHPFGPRVSQ